MTTAQYGYSEAERKLTDVLTKPQGPTTAEVVKAYEVYYAEIKSDTYPSLENVSEVTAL